MTQKGEMRMEKNKPSLLSRILSWPKRHWRLYQDRRWHINLFRSEGCKFVRSQCQLAEDNERATGLRMTLDDVLRIFGPDVLREIADSGSAVIIRDATEPARTFSRRRIYLGMTSREVAQKAGISYQELLDAEDPSRNNSIHTLVKIANVLGLDPDYISWKSGKRRKGWRY